MKLPSCAKLVVFLVCAGVGTLRAAIVVGTTANAIDTSVPVSYSQWEAQSIVTSADGSDVEVVSLSLEIEIVIPNEFFSLWIVPSDESGFRPDVSGGALVEFDTAPWKNNEADAILTPVPSETPPVLPGGATSGDPIVYWIVLGATAIDPETGNGRIDWSYASSGAGNTGDDGWSVGTSVASAGAEGTNWTHFSAASSPYLFELTTTVVPEPAALAPWIGLAVVASSLFRRRRLAE